MEFRRLGICRKVLGILRDGHPRMMRILSRFSTCAPTQMKLSLVNTGINLQPCPDDDLGKTK